MVQRKVIVRGATNQALDELDATDIPDLSAAYEAAGGIATHEGLANPHPGYLTPAEGDAAYEVIGATATHAAAGDPHTGYRLESADHSHASTGLQAGTVAHTALTSVGANDHHAQAHTHPAEGAVVVTHASTTGQGVDDHHAQSHTHASHTGIGANDHHAQTHATAHQPGGADTMAVDAAAATGSLRTLGTGALQAAVGSHTHSGASTAYAPGSFTVATDNFAIMVKRLQLTTTQRMTLAGTARLRIT